MTEEDQKNVTTLGRYIGMLVKPLVAPHEVKLKHGTVRDGAEHVWWVYVPGPGMRYAIGKRGANAEAIRTLVRARAGAMKWSRQTIVDVKILEAR